MLEDLKLLKIAKIVFFLIFFTEIELVLSDSKFTFSFFALLYTLECHLVSKSVGITKVIEKIICSSSRRMLFVDVVVSNRS